MPAFSNRWLASFKNRYNIKKRKNGGEAALIDLEEMERALIILRLNIAPFSPDDMYNFDELALF